MQVEFKLFATLMEYLPDNAVKNSVILDVAEKTTPNQLIDTCSVPRAKVHLVLINGVYVDETSRDHPMNANDVIAVWPPVAGG